jgi:hypothetical protein
MLSNFCEKIRIPKKAILPVTREQCYNPAALNSPEETLKEERND